MSAGPAALMHGYIVLSLLCGLRTEEARALRWQHVELNGDPAAAPPVPPHVAVWRSVRAHGTPRPNGLGALSPSPPRPSRRCKPGRTARPVSGSPPGRSGRTPGWSSPPPRRRTGCGQRPQDVQTRLREAGIGDSWTPRELRTSFVSLMSHHGVSIEEIARLVGHATTRTTEIVYRRELRPVITTGAEIMDQLFTEM